MAIFYRVFNFFLWLFIEAPPEITWSFFALMSISAILLLWAVNRTEDEWKK